MIKHCGELWDDLGFYVWVGNFRKANHVCELLDEIKEESLLVYLIGYLISPFCGA